MRKPMKTSLIRGYTFRIIGVALISMSPWICYSNSDDQQQIWMYIVAALGMAAYSAGIVVKARSERTPETMRIELSSQATWATIILCFAVIGFLLGSTYYQ